MSTQRVLILCHDVNKIVSFVQTPSLKGVHFSIFPDWVSSAAALRSEKSPSSCQEDPPNGGGGPVRFGDHVASRRRKPLVSSCCRRTSVLTVLDALKAGASEILFEESRGTSLATSLERNTCSLGYGPASTGCPWTSCSISASRSSRRPTWTAAGGDDPREVPEALGASSGCCSQEGWGGRRPYVVPIPPWDSPTRRLRPAFFLLLRRFGERSSARRPRRRPRCIPTEEARGGAPGGALAPRFETGSSSAESVFDLESRGSGLFSVGGGCGGAGGSTPSTAHLRTSSTPGKSRLALYQRGAQRPRCRASSISTTSPSSTTAGT
jgi:hypothetical protein